MLLAIDTETTGLGLHHGCLPFFVSMCTDSGERLCWEWAVDPFTRLPNIPQKDKLEILDYVEACELFILHNAKFDIRALTRAKIIKPSAKLWAKTCCTALLSHMRNSQLIHKLKPLGVYYLDINDNDEDELEIATRECIRFVKQHDLKWRIAKEGDPHFPTQKSDQEEGMWKNDCWLPAAVVNYCQNTKHEHGLSPAKLKHYQTVCKTYGLADAERTMGLYLVMKPRGPIRVYHGGMANASNLIKKRRYPKPIRTVSNG